MILSNAADGASEGHLRCVQFILENYGNEIDSDPVFKETIADPFAAFSNDIRWPHKAVALLRAAQKPAVRILEYLLQDPSVSIFADYENNFIFGVAHEVCKEVLIKIPTVALLHYAKTGDKAQLENLLQNNTFSSAQKTRALCLAIKNGQIKTTVPLLLPRCAFDDITQSLTLSVLNNDINKIKDILKEAKPFSASSNAAFFLLFLLADRPQCKDLILPFLSTHNIPLSLTPDNIKYGPLNKNLSTQSLELLYKIISTAPHTIQLSTKEGALFAQIDSQIFNISMLFKKAELSHIYKTDPQSPKLTTEEIETVKNYTSNTNFKTINDMLYGKINPVSSDSRLKEYFCKIISLAETLNKIEPSQTSLVSSYRMEQYVPDSELLERKKRIKTEGASFTRMIAFQSTSPDEEKMRQQYENSKSMMIYDSLSGINIAPYSIYPLEKEHLLFPDMVMCESFDESTTPIQFKAKILRPVLEEREAIICDEIEIFLFLNRITERLSLPSDTITPWAHRFLKRIDYDLLLAAKEVYNRYLSKSYARQDHGGSVSLETPLGTIYRPNHGLAHTLRCMMLIPVVAKALNLSLPDSEIKKLQLASLFFVVGRQNECSFSQDPTLYLSYRKASAQAFKQYAKK